MQDATGARISAAAMVVQSLDSSMKREATTEDRGEFRLDDLIPGTYRITVQRHGFADAQAEVSIAVSSVREVTVTLKPGGSRESVNVTGQSSSITTQPIDLVERGASGSCQQPGSCKPFRWRRAASPTSPIWRREQNRSSLPIRPRRASRRFRPAEVPD